MCSGSMVQSTISQKGRNSSIELLKIIALFFIVLCHSLPIYRFEGVQELAGYLDLSKTTSDVQQISLVFFSYLGQIGNALFIVPSAYFLLESSAVKKEKIVQYVLDTHVISALFLILFLVIRRHIPSNFIINSLAPTTYYFYWFVTCYILLYAIHPWLNIIIEKIDKKSLFFSCVWMFILYCGVSFILGPKYYYTNLVGFVVYYFFTAYCKKYLSRLSQNVVFNCQLLIWGTFGFVGLILICCIWSPLHIFLDRFETFINPFVVMISFAIFNLFKTKKFTNAVINKISSTSLLVFVISNNQLVCSFVKPVFFAAIYRAGYYTFIAPICMLVAVVTLFGSIILALIYMFTIRKYIVALGGKILSFIGFCGRKVYGFVSDIENNNRGGGGRTSLC